MNNQSDTGAKLRQMAEIAKRNFKNPDEKIKCPKCGQADLEFSRIPSADAEVLSEEPKERDGTMIISCPDCGPLAEVLL